MSTLKEQLDAEEAANKISAASKIIEKKPPQFGNPYGAEYIKRAQALQEKLIDESQNSKTE